MKYFFVVTCFLIWITPIFGQSPYAFNFQAVARGSDGEVISEKTIALRMSITEGHEEGSIVFSEEHEITTNERGLFTLQIGTGFPVLGNLRTIDWGQNLYFVRTEVDVEGGSDFEELGSAQLYSVPYALYAMEAGNATGDNGSTPTLLFNNDQLFIEGGNSVDLSDLRNDDDADATNELQNLSLSGNLLSISNGNTVILPNTGGGGADNQRLSFEGTVLSIENGNSVNLSSLQDGFTDADADNTNELQTLSLSEGILSISNGNSVTLPTTSSSSNSPWQSISSEEIYYPGDQIRIGNDFEEASVLLGEGAAQNGLIQLSQLVDEDMEHSLILDSDIGQYGFDELGRLTHMLGYNDDENFSYLSLFHEDQVTIQNSMLSSKAGFVRVRGPNEKDNMRLTTLANYPNNGFLSICDNNGDTKIRSYVGSDDVGIINTIGPNSNRNVALTFLTGHENNGYVTVYDASDSEKAGIYVDQQGRGVIFADVKNFKVQHPDDEDYEIFYASIEGPEAAIYIRGTSSLESGEARLELPDHFSGLASEKGLTVQLTPLSSGSKGLSVVTKNTKFILIKELWDGTGSYEFDWEVKAVRSSFEDYQVIRKKGSLKTKSVVLEDLEVIESHSVNRER